MGVGVDEVKQEGPRPSEEGNPGISNTWGEFGLFSKGCHDGRLIVWQRTSLSSSVKRHCSSGRGKCKGTGSQVQEEESARNHENNNYIKKLKIPNTKSHPH
jgi:hypothetical protein